MDVRAFHTSLDKSFVPLVAREIPRAVMSEAALRALPQRIDAGPPLEVWPLATSDAGTRPMFGPQALLKAWEAYGAGRTDEARRLKRLASQAGARDADLNELLGQ